jgi:hypothetical protein
MAITAKKGEAFEKELIEAGNYVARCYKMIEIGTVDEEFLGVKKQMHKVRIGWELPTELKTFNPEKGEQPCVIDKEYTLSLADKANLRKDLQSWRGKAFSDDEAEAFDITKLLGVPCMLNIIHVQGKKDPTKTYQAIGSVSPMPKGLVCPPQVNDTFVFDYENFDDEKFNSLPDFLKEQIVKTPEYKEAISQTVEASPFFTNLEDNDESFI